MKRFLLIAAGFFGLSLILFVVAAVGFRGALAEWALERALERDGQPVEVTVSRFTSDQLILTGIKSQGATVERLTADYSLANLLSGEVDGVLVEGLRAKADLSAPGEGAGEPLDLPPLPPVRLRDAEIELITPQGSVTVTAKGRITNPEEDLIAARLMLGLETDYGSFKGPLDATFKNLDPSFLELILDSDNLLWGGQGLGPATLQVRLLDGQLSSSLFLQAPSNRGRVEFELDSLAEREGLQLRASLELLPDSPLWSFLPNEGLQASGSLSASLSLPRPMGAAARLADPDLSPAGLLAALTALDAETSFSADLQDVTAKGSPRPLDAGIGLTQDAAGARLTARFGQTSGPTRLDLQADLESAGELLVGSLSFEGALSAEDAILRAFLPTVPEGDLAFSGELSATLPPGLPRGLSGLLAASPSGEVRITGKGLAWGSLVKEGGLSTRIGIESDGAELSLTLAADSRFSAMAGPALTLPDFLTSEEAVSLAPLEGPLALQLSEDRGLIRIETEGGLQAIQGERQLVQKGAFSMTLEPAGPAVTSDQLSLTVSALPLPQGLLSQGFYEGSLSYSDGVLALEGDMEAALSLQGLGGLEAESIILSGPLLLFHDPRLSEISFPEGLALALPGGLTVQGYSLAFSDPLRIEALTARHAGTLDALTLEVALPAVSLSGPSSVEVETGGRISLLLEEGRLKGRGAIPSLRLPDQQAALGDFTLSADLAPEYLPKLVSTGEDPPLTVSVAQLSHPALTGGAVTISATQAEELIELSGALTLAGGNAVLPLSGTFQQETGRLEATLGGQTLLFSKGGLQPAGLSPLLTALEEVAGEITPTIWLTVTETGLRARGRLRADGLDFATAGTSIRAMNGTLVFTDLLAPRSDGVQEITIARADPAVPIRSITARFSVEPDDQGQPLLLIERVTGATDFGPVTITEGRLTPLTQSGWMKIDFPELDLAQLTALLGVEGLSATGKLSGSLPIGLEAGVLQIDQGRLDDQENGVIRYDSLTARQALAGGGESVTLMLDALENFQYQDFGVTLDKPSDKELTVSFSLEGKNPEVLDGYPFRFNINLTTDPTSLLQALRLGSDIGKLLLDRTGTFPSGDP